VAVEASSFCIGGTRVRLKLDVDIAEQKAYGTIKVSAALFLTKFANSYASKGAIKSLGFMSFKVLVNASP
jgi:hypothetical protein